MGQQSYFPLLIGRQNRRERYIYIPGTEVTAAPVDLPELALNSSNTAMAMIALL